ncbi:MAG: (Fe-S)-binding protein [Desulfobulbaceae bacterium]|nr:MAG: (Fe-S)-binding protein [Desulfobulbaceae bacterium]
MNTKIYVLHFPKETGDKPIICELVKKYDVDFNILKATILPGNDGLMVLELTGHRSNVKKALEFLQNYGVKIEPISTIIRRDDSHCIQCGACTGICPTHALYLDRTDMSVLFDPDKCTGCGLCVAVCPVRAMEVALGQDIVSEA